MNNQKLEVTGLKSLPLYYKGEPCIVTFEIIDIEGGVYKSEVHMDAGFNPKSLQDAACESFKLCDATPSKVKIKTFKIKG